MKGWHLNAQEAARQLGKDWKYVSLKPGRFHLWSSEKFTFEYKPDVSWLYPEKGRGDRVVVWEIESGAPDNKRICGDVALAALLRRNNAYCYLDESEETLKLGSELRYDEPSDWKGGNLIGRKGQRKVTPEIAAFFLVVEEKFESKMREDIEPYVNVIRNKTDLLKGVRVYVCGIPHSLKVEEMKKMLKKDCVINLFG